MSKLKAIKPKKAAPKKPKILIYGKPGVGKTWASLDFPGVYYMDSEGGANLDHYTDKLEKSGGVYFGVEQGALDFETIIEQVKALATEKHPYKTLVIDSISKVFNSAIAAEMDRLGDKDQFGASKRLPVSLMRRLVGWLSRLDMNVILVSHEKAEWGLNSRKERVEIGSTFDCWDKLEYELDLCLNIIKAGTNRNAFIRKSRLEQFEEATHFPWSYQEFADKFGITVIEDEVKTIELAKPEQLSRMKQLLETVKLPDGQESKWLKKEGVEGWDDMSSDRIAAAIKHVEKTYLTQTEEKTDEVST